MTPATAAIAPVDERQAAAPPVPRTLEDIGLALDQLEQLLLKTLYGAEATGHSVAERMRLPYALIEPLVERARAQLLVEVRGATGSGTAGFRYSLTDLGRERARQFLEISRYTGPTPVPLSAYVTEMRALAAVRGHIERGRLSQGFAHLIVRGSVLEQLGPAINSGKAVFLYGPPGNGKTVIAEGMGRAIGGDMYVPHAIDIDGHIVTVFDPISHEPLEAPRADGAGADPLPSVTKPSDYDRRWVRVRRPVVIVGGELTLAMLDLTFNPIAKFYEAPLQLKANGGIFLVDDFGRQRMRPEDLLNRWIVPLESRVDYLTLHTGKKFQIPFDVLTVFATNLNPQSLADEAFLRRIPYKIPIEDPSMEEFTRIFEMNCERRHLKFDPVIVAYLHRRHYMPTGRHLRACHPRDLLDQVTAFCRYRGVEPTLTRELMDVACETYFMNEERGVEGTK
jgi:hypothetical protein